MRITQYTTRLVMGMAPLAAALVMLPSPFTLIAMLSVLLLIAVLFSHPSLWYRPRFHLTSIHIFTHTYTNTYTCAYTYTHTYSYICDYTYNSTFHVFPITYTSTLQLQPHTSHLLLSAQLTSTIFSLLAPSLRESTQAFIWLGL